MNGRALISLITFPLRMNAWGMVLFLLLFGGGATLLAAPLPTPLPGDAGQGKNLGPANFSERAQRESPSRVGPLKGKPYRLRHPGSAPSLPVDPALIGRETSPRQARKTIAPAAAAPSSATVNRASLAEADGSGGPFMPASAGTSPTPSASFPALRDDGFSSVPDTQGAVGPNHLMATLASQIRVQDRAGNTNLTMTLSNFWSSTPNQPGLDVFDPRLVYDSLAQRWIHVANANPSDVNPGLLIAVSQTTDPTGLWNRYFIDVDTVNGVFIDSPNVGFNKNWITVSANTFDSTNFEYFSQEIWVFNKARLYANQSAQFTHFAPNVEGGPANVPVPVSTYDATNATQYFVGHYDGDSDDSGYLRVFTVSGAIGSEVFSLGAFITDIGVGSPPWSAYSPDDDNFGPQAGTTNKLYLGDARVVNGVYRESSSTLWVAHTIFLPSEAPTHSAVQWWEFTPGGAVVQRGRVNDTSAVKFYAYPSIAVSRGLDVVVGYSRFAANQFPSANFSYRVDDDLLSTMRPDTVLKAGESNYIADVNGFNVWGDWSATAVDPANDTDIWTLQEYAMPHVLETNVEGLVTNIVAESRWGTWWGRISPIRDLTLAMTDAPDPIVAGGNVTYTLSFTNARPPNAQPQIVPGTRIVDTLPAGSVFVSATPNQGSCAATGSVVTCNFGNLAVGATGRVTIVTRLLNSGTAVNTATVSASGPDPNPAGNTVSINTTVSALADIALLMTSAPSPATVSNQLVFSVIATNRGPSTATGVIVTNTLPANVTYISSIPSQGSCTRNGSIVTCNLGAITAITAATVAITVAPNAAGQYTNRATVGTSAADPTTSNNATSVVSRANFAPTIGVISNRTINEDTTLGPLTFAVGDVETPAANLTLQGLSSNTNIVPNENILFSGSGSTRAVTVIPTPNANGVVSITRFVVDADGAQGSNSFQLTITPMNDPPFMSDIPSQTINEDTVLAPVSFTVGDIESGASGLTVSGASSNPTLVPNANIAIAGAGANRTVSLIPATNQFGTAIIAITVNDGQSVTNKSFLLTVVSANDLPTVTDLPDQAVNEDTVVGPLSFTIGDAETASSSLVPIGLSSNQALVPNGNIIFGGSGSSRTVTILPAVNQFGTTVITIVISDGTGTTSDTFTLTVNPVNDAPTLNGISNVILSASSGPTTVSLTGIGAGATNESQTLSISASSGNPGLIPTPSITYTSPDTTGTLTFTPSPNSNGTVMINVTVNDNAGSNNITTRSFSVSVLAANHAPSISDIASLTLAEDTSTNLSFIIGDSDSPPGSLTLAGRSSDTNVVPSGNIIFGGSGSNRNVTITPAPNANGSSVITILVSDGAATNSDTFTITILEAPEPPAISPIANVTINEDTASSVISFTVDSSETLPANLTVNALSSNPDLLPANNIVVGGSGADRTLRLFPLTNQFGTSMVTVVVSDGAMSSSNAFLFTVLSVNDLPSLSAFIPQAIDEDTSTGPIDFTVQDIETAVGSLTPSGSSSDPVLLPPTSFTFGGSGSSRTVSIQPATNRFGTTTVTITLSDLNGGVVSNSFLLTVNPINDPPEINAVANLATNRDAGPVTINLSGIGAGGFGEIQTLTVTASSSNPEVISDPIVTYTSPGATGSLVFTPVPTTNGSATITITVTDDAPTNNTFSRVFQVTTVSQNRVPTLNPIAGRNINEDAGVQVVNFDGVSSGSPAEAQVLTITASSSNPALIPTPTVSYTSPATNGFLSFTPVPNGNGAANITVTVNDNGGSNNLFSQVFTVNVTSINDAPTLSSIAPQSTLEDTPFNFSVTVGDLDTPLAALTLSAISSNPSLVQSGSFAFSGSAASRTVVVTPLTNAFGSAVVTLIVNDGSGGSASNSFLLNVTSVADLPSVSDIPNQTIAEDSQPTINFTVSDPEGTVATLMLTATSSNPGLLPPSSIQFGGSAANRSVTLKPLANRFGTATVTVVATASSGVSATDLFVVTVTNINDAPTLSGLPDLTINEDTPTGPLSITVGDLETLLANMTPTANSSNPTLVPIGNIVFGGTGADRTVTITPGTNQFGASLITLSLSDGNGGSTNIGFLLNVAAVNDPPTLNILPNLATNRSAGSILVPLSGISAGGGESQSLTLTATSSNPALLPNPAIAYTSPSTSGALTLTPLPNVTGQSTITVSINDGSASNNLVTRTFALSIGTGNTAPTISAIGNQQINEDTPLNTGFIIADGETATMSLLLSATSTNSSLVPNANIFFNGSGSNQTLTVIPATNAFGTTLITVSVSDGAATNSTSFLLTVSPVNDPPTLAYLLNFSTNSAIGAAHVLSLNGISTGAANEGQNLSITAVSSNPTLLPNPSVSYSSPANNGILILRPGSSQQGNATVTVTVTEAGAASNNTVVRTFQVNIKSSGNVPPGMSLIPSQTVQEDGVIGPIGFTIGDATTAAASLVVRVDSSNPLLLPTQNIILGGSGANRNLTLIPTLHQSGVAIVYLTVTDTAFGSTNQAFMVTVSPANHLPIISVVSSQSASEDTVIGPVLFNVSDGETPARSLTVTATSANQVLVPNANILLGGNGSNRAVRIIPATNQSGSANITLSVSDGTFSVGSSFLVTWSSANDGPTISAIANQTVARDAATGPLAFTVNDAETAAGSLNLTADSSNQSLVPLNRIVFGGGGGSRTVTVTPASNQVGSATITVNVSDGTSTATSTFLLTVNSVDSPNIAPTLDAPGNLNLAQNAPAQTVNLTGIGSGSVSESQTLMVAASSSNPALIPNPAVTYTSPNSFGTLTLLPCPNTNGTATITVRVNDGQTLNNLVIRTFTVTVNAAPAMAGPTNVVIAEDGTVSGIPFTVSDLETPAASLTVQAFSSNPGLLPNGSVVPGGVGVNRTLALTPVGNQSGFSTITLTVMDGTGNTSSNSFLVTVVPVNDGPTLNPLDNLSVSSGAGPQNVNLSGIGSGAPNESQLLLVLATSSNPSIIPDPVVIYASPASSGVLTYTPVTNTTGSAVITVRVMDDGGTAHGGVNSITRTFTVTVSGSGPGMPTLQIDRSDANVVLSWPISSGSTWVLQHNSTVTNHNGWTTVGSFPTIVADRYTVTLPANSSPKFYRLCGACPL